MSNHAISYYYLSLAVASVCIFTQLLIRSVLKHIIDTQHVAFIELFMELLLCCWWQTKLRNNFLGPLGQKYSPCLLILLKPLRQGQIQQPR